MRPLLKGRIPQQMAAGRLRHPSHREARTVRARAISQPVHDPSASIVAALEMEIHILEARFLSYAPATQYLLRSIPGIGPICAASLVAHIGDIRRFPSPEKLVAYVGLDCRVHQSGTSVHGRGYISKRGNHRLRAVLFNAAFIARQTNPDMKAFFEKKLREGKHYVSALNAVERKLLHLIYAVWTRGTPFEQRATLRDRFGPVTRMLGLRLHALLAASPNGALRQLPSMPETL
jgi:transposase